MYRSGLQRDPWRVDVAALLAESQRPGTRALHLAAAQGLGGDLGGVVAYDERCAAPKAKAGLRAIAPSRLVRTDLEADGRVRDSRSWEPRVNEIGGPVKRVNRLREDRIVATK
jgi:hypothetical protein